MPFIDFTAVKEAVSFADAISYLDLNLKQTGHQWRGACPACNQGGDRALVLTEGKGWYCFAFKKGGDVIALAAHILDVSPKEAAQELAIRAGIVPSTSTSGKVQVPESEAAKDKKPAPAEGMQPLSYLEPAHDAVIAVGFDPDFSAKHGIGYAGKGVARGNVLVPFRDEHGTLLGYIGITDAWLPQDFQTNVVPIRKRA